MATTHQNPYELHDHAGAKWLAGAGVAFGLALISAVMMIVYPHV